ncbi:trypsin-like peptidase domain-containing protein [Gracilibacillus sp. S3-1-1]|uniref:Trypsin-like peptidase domain-containing protein n=1 Tax=Gracilibacillus pellucidus TaxID=3095368 RepID=A0ACC6M606_9BACI|nr:trypsin-like peptidase domain-containing protein [Gracilibacillus sp. S3-1-1]MDX8046331.1 trypsin-like peptidase domain-containing protein [Gracilibacillus sp. S3-1-1]
MSEEFNQQPTEQQEETQTVVEQPKAKKSKSTLSYLVSGVAGGVIAALFTSGIFINTINNDDAASADNDETATQATTSESVPTANVANQSTNSIGSAVQKVSDAVVGVSNIQQVDLWEEAQPAGTGSGVIYKKDGEYAYVVTNNHVVEGAQQVKIVLTDGENVNATVMGTDSLSDLAVLRIPSDKVTTVAELGSSDNLSVGDTAIAIGNPLGEEFAGSVTQGIISGLNRGVDVDLTNNNQADWTVNVIQTDAAINPGNSGGALINGTGEVIGINSMKIAQSSVEGIGFAIPVDDAKPIIEQLETGNDVARPFIGISALDLASVPQRHVQDTLHLDDNVDHGIVIAQVEPSSAADKAGLQQYDVVTKIDDQDIHSMLDLRKYLYSETNVGQEVNVTFFRDGNLQTAKLVLDEQSNIQ